MRPLVTVVVPTFNRANLILATIESVLRQKYDTIEIIVVDDGSTDDTEAVVRSISNQDKRVRFMRREADRAKGANSCRNIGWEHANGEFIKWLDSDDLLEDNCIEKQVKAITSEKVRVCFCRTGLFEERGGVIARLNKLWSERIIPKKLPDELVYSKIRWDTISGLWRREDFEQPPFKEGLMNSQEWLFHIQQSLCKSFTACYLNDILCLVRVHEGSMSDRRNKKGRYYYNEAYARWLAIQRIWITKPPGYKKMIRFLLKKLSWFHAYSLYKQGYGSFIQLFKYYPRIFFYLIS